MPRKRACVFNCPGQTSLFSFPDPVKHKDRRKEWLRILNVKTKAKYVFACGRHFSATMRNQSFLKNDAVPDINLERDDNLTATTTTATTKPIIAEPVKLYEKLKPPRDEIKPTVVKVPRKPVHGSAFVVKIDTMPAAAATKTSTLNIIEPTTNVQPKQSTNENISISNKNTRLPHTEVRILEVKRLATMPLPSQFKPIETVKPTPQVTKNGFHELHTVPFPAFISGPTLLNTNDRQEDAISVLETNEKISLPYAKLLCDEEMPHDCKDDGVVAFVERSSQTTQWLSDQCPRKQKMLQEFNDMKKSTKEQDAEIKRMRLEHDKFTSQLLLKVSTLNQIINEQDKRIQRLETFARKKDFLLLNVAEAETTNDELIQIVIKLVYTIGICLTANEIDCVERIGVKVNNKKRPILVSLTNLRKKMQIMSMKKMVVGFSISEPQLTMSGLE